MVGRAAVGLLGCFKKEGMSEAALLQAAEKAKKYYLRPAADTEGWQALQPFGQTEVLVSVIVPVHNGEKDLKQCLNSILAQECGSTVEIIAVNDNSTDSSSDILEEYANWGEVRMVDSYSVICSCRRGLIFAIRYLSIHDSNITLRLLQRLLG